MDKDIFRAYRLPQIGLTREGIYEILDRLSKVKNTYRYVYELVYSDRTPKTVIHTASKIGMYIPVSKRIGLQAYEFFIHNVEYYEPLFKRKYRKYPSQDTIFRSSHIYEILSMYPDSEILKIGFIFPLEYTDRKDMLKKFIEDNYNNIGKFYLHNNQGDKYLMDTQSILYVHGDEKTMYSIKELQQNIDTSTRVFRKNEDEVFHPFSSMQLRHSVLVKLEQWKDRDSSVNETLSGDLQSLVKSLDQIVIN